VKSTVAELTEEEQEEIREGNKVEPKNVKTFQQEVLISSLQAGFQNIVAGEHSPLKRGILEVK
jgi:acyl-CoA thioesterase